MAPEAPERQPDKKPDAAKKAPNKNVESRESQETREVRRKADRQIAVEQAKTDTSYKNLEDYLATNYGFDKDYYRKLAAKDDWPSIDIFLDDKDAKATPKQKKDILEAYKEWGNIQNRQTIKHMQDAFSAKEIELLEKSNWSEEITIGATPERPTKMISTNVYVDNITKQFTAVTGVG